jgi:hypothetical protein
LRRIQFRPSNELGEQIEARRDVEESDSLVARRMAARYAEMCLTSIPYFTPLEWRAIESCSWQVDAGAMWPRAVAYQLVTGGLAGRFELDGEAMLGKLEALSVAQAWAALDVLERYRAREKKGLGPAALPGEARLAR